jgi:hypothetical protein
MTHAMRGGVKHRNRGGLYFNDTKFRHRNQLVWEANRRVFVAQIT